MIRHNHPDLKGSFTCLGNWYNVLHKDSMKALNIILKDIHGRDLMTARKEIKHANDYLQLWKPDSCLEFLYKKYDEENHFSTTK
jgi:hypothetical protein